MSQNLKKSSLRYKLRQLWRQLPSGEQIDRLASLAFAALMLGAMGGGAVWLIGQAIDDYTMRPLVFIDPADGVLEAGEQWEKVHRITAWSEQDQQYIDVTPGSPLWDQILGKGDFNVSYAYDQTGIRFPNVAE